MLLPWYDKYTPPEHPYIRASSAYSPIVQLYARSGQLDCAYTRFLRFGDMSPLCLAGCDDLETIHHVCVICPSFWHLHTDAANNVHAQTAKILHNADIPLIELRAPAASRTKDVYGRRALATTYLSILSRNLASSPICSNHKTVTVSEQAYPDTATTHLGFRSTRLAGRI